MKVRINYMDEDAMLELSENVLAPVPRGRNMLAASTRKGDGQRITKGHTGKARSMHTHKARS